MRTMKFLNKFKALKFSNSPIKMSASITGDTDWTSPGWEHKINYVFATVRT